MPNPTSKLNLVINGTTTQLDIHDANAVDLSSNQTVAGNKEFTGTTTAHDLVPSATDTYNFGSPSYQWNNAYIKSLTINGVACGDILTHNANEFAYDTDVVHKSGDETITNGAKTFESTAPLRIQGCNKGNESSPNARTVLELRSNRDTVDKSCIYISKFRQNRPQGEMGDNDSTILAIDVLENGVRTNNIFRFTFKGWVNDVPTKVYLEPYNSNTSVFLGSPGHTWSDVGTNAINGLNPGALSLPGTSVNVDTTNWVLDGSDVNSFTPTSDGWLGIQCTDTVYDQTHYVFVGRTGGGSTYYPQNLMSPISALWDNLYHGCIFIPVIKNMNYDIRCICNNIVAKFYPCQGNV